MNLLVHMHCHSVAPCLSRASSRSVYCAVGEGRGGERGGGALVGLRSSAVSSEPSLKYPF